MSRPFQPLPARPALDSLIERSRETFDAMTPLEKGKYIREQRRSWVIGEMMLSNPEMTREEAAAIYDKVCEESGL